MKLILSTIIFSSVLILYFIVGGLSQPAYAIGETCPNSQLVGVQNVNNQGGGGGMYPANQMTRMEQSAAASFNVVRQAIIAQTGVDALAVVGDMLRSPGFSGGNSGSIYASYHKTGRAVDLNQGGPFQRVQEGSYFRLYVNSVDITAIFEANGWNRIPSNAASLEWWHYEYHPGGLTWESAMRQVWDLATLQSAFPNIDWTKIDCQGGSSTLPVPTTSPGQGGITVLPVGEFMNCNPRNWVTSGPNIIYEIQKCSQGEELIPNPAYTGPPVTGGGDIRCEVCGTTQPPPVLPPLYSSVPTEQDAGQKDGTGQMAQGGTFNHYDYERGEVINVPPLAFGLPGSSATYSFGTPVNAGTPTPGGTVNNNVPCGWPNEASTSRTVSSGCSAPLNNPGHCPVDASFCAEGVAHTGGLQAIDVSGQFPVYATMDGTAFRCLNSAQQTSTLSYGIYVRIIGTGGYSTITAHLQAQLPADSQASGRPADSQCLGSDIEVSRTAIQKGQYIGVVGLTGLTTGYHTHYEIWQGSGRLCPATFMDYTNSACPTSGVTSSGTNVPENLGLIRTILRSINPFEVSKT